MLCLLVIVLILGRWPSIKMLIDAPIRPETVLILICMIVVKTRAIPCCGEYGLASRPERPIWSLSLYITSRAAREKKNCNISSYKVEH